MDRRHACTPLLISYDSINTAAWAQQTCTRTARGLQLSRQHPRTRPELVFVQHRHTHAHRRPTRHTRTANTVAHLFVTVEPVAIKHADREHHPCNSKQSLHCSIAFFFGAASPYSCQRTQWRQIIWQSISANACRCQGFNAFKCVRFLKGYIFLPLPLFSPLFVDYHGILRQGTSSQ